MQSASTTEDGPSVVEHCPFSNLMRAQAVMPHVSVPVPAQVSFGELRSHPAVKPQTQARLRVSLFRSRQKRGPPLLLA
jgi:hypothetical protein